MAVRFVDLVFGLRKCPQLKNHLIQDQQNLFDGQWNKW